MRKTALLLSLFLLLLSFPQSRAQAMDSAFSHSDSYSQSEYHDRLTAVELTGDFRRDIVAVALSQVGYHEGGRASDLSGSSSGSGNFTEYGRNFGLEGDSWCATFVWWCARQAGAQESIIHKTEWAKSHLQPFDCLRYEQSLGVQEGDIAYVDTGGSDGREDHVGIVSAVTDKEITLVEGNSSNRVTTHTYSRSSGKRLTGSGSAWIVKVGSPDYAGENVSRYTYSTPVVYAPGAQAYASAGGRKTGVLENREYMVLSDSTSGDWIQIVASDGLGSWYIRTQGASFAERNLPPITGYNAWGDAGTTAHTTTTTLFTPPPAVVTTLPPAVTVTTAAPATTVTTTVTTTLATTDTTAATSATTASAAEISASDVTESTTLGTVPTQTTAEEKRTEISAEQPSSGSGWAVRAIIVIAGIAGVALSACAAGNSRRRGRRR